MLLLLMVCTDASEKPAADDDIDIDIDDNDGWCVCHWW